MASQEERIKRLLEAIFAVHQDEPMACDCDTCAQNFDCLVEMVNNGANIRELLPAVEEHLRCCADCREEFQALIAIVRAEAQGPLSQPSES